MRLDERDLDRMLEVVKAACAAGSMDPVDGGVWQKQDGQLGVRVSPDVFVIARSLSWSTVEAINVYLERFCPRTLFFLLAEINKLRQLLAQSQDSSAARILELSKLAMDLKQMDDDFREEGFIYEPDESWPENDVRRSFIKLQRQVKP